MLLNSLFFLGAKDHRLLYFDKRFFNHRTYLQCDKKILGPISDEKVGLEQGNVSSSDLYAIYNKEHLDNVQALGLGVKVFGQHVSADCLADDVLLLSDNIYFLRNILSVSLA